MNHEKGTGQVELVLNNRTDILSAFNNADFILRHYARGYYPTSSRKMSSMPVNRLFFPLGNPHGPENYISDPFGKHELVPGRMYFVPAFLPSCFCLDRELYFLSIQTNLDLFPGVELFSGCTHMLDLPCPGEAEALLNLFDSPEVDAFFASIKVGSLVLSIMASLPDLYEPEDFWRPLALKQYISLTDYLRQSGTARTSVCELAELCGESREHFTRRFRNCTGITPKQLIDRFVVGRCMSLIANGLRFKEIAEKLQFSNEFVFSRYFKRNLGESPRSWREHQPHK